MKTGTGAPDSLGALRPGQINQFENGELFADVKRNFFFFFLLRGNEFLGQVDFFFFLYQEEIQTLVW